MQIHKEHANTYVVGFDFMMDYLGNTNKQKQNINFTKNLFSALNFILFGFEFG